jgi:peptidyl-prolyl cis-trans isomerase B (cyclophilin B)
VLGPDYTVFGHMDEESTALVAQVAADGTESGLGDGVPATPVDITAVTIG